MHAEQRRDSLERRPVAHAGRHGDDGTAGETTDHAGQRTLHSGDHDDDVGAGHAVDLGQETVQPGHATVVDSFDANAVGDEDGATLGGDGLVGGTGGDDQNGGGTDIGRQEWSGPPHDGVARSFTVAVSAEHGVGLMVVDAREDHRRGIATEELPDDGHALLGRLAGGVHRLGGSLPQCPVMVDARKAEIGERKAPQNGDGVVGPARAGPDLVEQEAQGGLVHSPILIGNRRRCAMPILSAVTTASSLRVAYLGPAGTFTEQALRTQPDLVEAEHSLHRTFPDVFYAVEHGDADLAFVAIENSIEGSVNVTIDTLAFESELKIQREVVIPIVMNLLVQPGTSLPDVETVVSIPIAIAQCRGWLRENLPAVDLRAANATAEAVEIVAEAADGSIAAIGTSLAAEMYGLDILAADIEDHPGNETRFVVVAPEGVPTPTGHDKTSIVIFQRADQPGSLLAILQEFAGRGINLTKLESRPTKQGLGDYCFLIDCDGHIGDEVVADALRDLRWKGHGVKFLGSFPAAGLPGEKRPAENADAWADADAWVADIRSTIID